MSKTVNISVCGDCPNREFIGNDLMCQLASDKHGPSWGKENGPIPSWCPLPDTQGQRWQGIETAPKDTVVLLFDGEDIGIGFVDQVPWNHATHWMSLPAPPEVKK